MRDSQVVSFCFADGVLSVNTPASRIRLRWHFEPLAEEFFVVPERWRPCWPDLRILKPYPVGVPLKGTGRGQGPPFLIKNRLVC